jgi:hypothetical protein
MDHNEVRGWVRAIDTEGMWSTRGEINMRIHAVDQRHPLEEELLMPIDKISRLIIEPQ